MTATSDPPAAPAAGSAASLIPPGGVAPSGPPSSTPPTERAGRTPKTPAAGAREARPAAGHHHRETGGRQRATDPARSAPRTFTIELPAGLKLLSLNDRLNRYVKNERFQVIKDAAITTARKAKMPQLQRARIVAVYEPPDRRPRDADNPIASVKAAVDGLVIAGVLPNDECPRYVTGIYCTIGEPYPKGRLVLHVTEAEPLAGAA